MKLKKISLNFFYIYLILCILVGTIGTTFFLIQVDQKWIGVAETYFLQNEEIQKQIGTYKKIKCEGYATKADDTGLPVYYVVETESGKFDVTLWVKQNKDMSHVVVAHLIENS